MELVPEDVSHDTVEALAMLLERAKSGEITGLTYAAILRRRRYIVDVAGTARKYPTFARGMIGALDDCLAKMIHDR